MVMQTAVSQLTIRGTSMMATRSCMSAVNISNHRGKLKEIPITLGYVKHKCTKPLKEKESILRAGTAVGDKYVENMMENDGIGGEQPDISFSPLCSYR